MEHMWLTLCISTLIVGLFIYLVYFGMFRFHSHRNFYLLWSVILLGMAVSSYLTIRAGSYMLFFGPLVTTAFLFIRDWRKLKRLTHENKNQ